MTVRLMFVRTSRGVYQLAGTPAPVELRLAGWKSTAVVTLDGEDYILRMRGLFDRGPDVYRAIGNQHVLSLRRRYLHTTTAHPASWRVRMRLRGYEAHLEVPSMGSIALRMGFGGKSTIEVDADGNWPHRDLVVVAAAFAVIIRRREDSGSGAAVVATTAAVS
jgi:hypothetical protein